MVPIGDFAGILIHGLIFGMLVVGSQMYVNAAAPAELRGQAQGLIGLIMFSLGTFLSNYVFDVILQKNVVAETGAHSWTQPYLIALVVSLVLAALMAVAFKPANRE
jgi:MFS family permease